MCRMWYSHELEQFVLEFGRKMDLVHVVVGRHAMCLSASGGACCVTLNGWVCGVFGCDVLFFSLIQYFH